MGNETSSSKGQILKSTGIVGSSQVLTVLLQVVRTKLIAVLLGPVGVGMLGIYNTIVEMVRNTTGLGINFSGVREIAQSSSDVDQNRVAEKSLLLKRWAIITGIIGGLLLILFCYPISILSFGDSAYAISIALLSISVFFTSINQSQIALLQGMRKLLFMAKASVIGVALSIIIVSPIYYFWHLNGMIVAIILMSISSFILSHYYVRKLKIPKVTMTYKDTYLNGREMIKIGFASSISSIITTATMYIVRSFISNKGDLEDVGMFQASWTISNVYLLSVLNAMAADYFPRLSAINNNNEKLNKLVNDQSEVAIVVGGFLVVLMISCSSLIIDILYSEDFRKSAVLLLFFSLGSFFKLLSWPISFVTAAKGAIKQIIISEVTWNFCFLTITMRLWNKLELLAVGISYVFSYIIYLILVFLLVDRLCRFRWDIANIKHIVVFSILIVTASLISFYYENGLAPKLVIVLLALLYIYSYLTSIININGLVKKFFCKE